jgi:DNA ligase-1
MKDWTHFTRLAELCIELESVTKKRTKVELVSEFLGELKSEEIAPAVYLVVGSVFAEDSSKTLKVNWSTLQKVFEEEVQKPLQTKELTILDVHNSFNNVAKASGPGSRKRKKEILRSLFTQASKKERRWIIKNIFGEMQHGVGEGVMIEAIAQASDVPRELVARANMFSGNLGRVATISLTEGEKGLDRIGIQLFTPIKPMLAKIAEDIDVVFEEHGRPTAFEFKFDGARIQIHINQDDVRIYSRRLTEVTHSLPDIIQLVREKIQAEKVILEGEVIAVGEEGKPFPFQDLMRRFTRRHDVKTLSKEMPLMLHLFDCLYYNGKSLVDMPYDKRWQRLSEVSPSDLLADRIISGNTREVEEFLQEAVRAGHEGLMVKRLDSPYTPGRRGKRWLKIKPADRLDLAIVAADWGYGRRTGWLSNYHLAVIDKETGQYEVVGKTFKGLTDKQFKRMTARLQKLKIREGAHTVYVRPDVVVEVAYNEIQRSPKYKSGFALRFARVKRIRDDKPPREVPTIDDIRRLYEEQFTYKSKKL